MTTGAVNAWTNHDDNQFTAIDFDPDGGNNLADYYKGGWWYTSGFYAKLTGLYGETIASYHGLIWEIWLGADNLQYADMKIKVN